jgi:hypothetical protein
MNKVFCIGFHKTGTSSLGRALEILGYRVCGSRLDLTEAVVKKDFDTLFVEVNKYDAFHDNPWPLIYKFLDKKYPNSKFILTVRDEKKWIKSIINHFENRDTKMRELIYGVGHPMGNEDVYLSKYNSHNSEVRGYFESYSDDLLVLKLEKDFNWNKLCNFLEKEIPNITFPFLNKGDYGIKKILKKTKKRLQMAYETK